MLNVKLNKVNKIYTVKKSENAVIFGYKFLTP